MNGNQEMTDQTNARSQEPVSCPDYSVVIPVYYNEGALTNTLNEIKEKVVAVNPNLIAELVFVDDGSGDGSLAELLKLRDENPGLVRVVKLSRNFGQVNALMAGFSQAKGRCVVVISADCQDPVELIDDMIKAHFEENYEIVICHREERDEPFFRKLTSQIFYSLVRRLSFSNMPEGGFDYFLLGRKALQVILRNTESQAFIQGQILWTGFDIKFLSYRRTAREIGTSRWTFGKKVTYLIDGIMGYSFFPIRMMSIIGALIAMTGFLYALVIIAIKLFWGSAIQGWAALMVVSLVLGGIQVLMLGVIGEYMWRSLAEARNRDAYIIEDIYD